MAQLAFKQRFIEPIQEGRKRQTLRKQTLLKEGDLVTARCQWNAPPFAYLRVTAVERVERDLLTGLDAHLDGFDSLDEMLDFMDRTYGCLESCVRVSFELTEAPALSGT